ncbi:MAG: hypothetical protein LC722_02515 [Actinobacteria bacterium]|nr:hypothetical protein [Actinomycetota bacterium]
MAVILFLIISGVSSLILVVMVVGLGRHVRVLGGSLQRFREEIEPVMTGIRADAETARVRLESAAEAAEAIRPSEPRGPR